MIDLTPRISRLEGLVQSLTSSLSKLFDTSKDQTIMKRLFLNGGDPKSDLEAATKHYVDFCRGSGGLILAETPIGIVNGSNPTFTFRSPPVLGSVSLYIDGKLQPNTSFAVIGSTLTIAAAPSLSVLVSYSVKF